MELGRAIAWQFPRDVWLRGIATLQAVRTLARDPADGVWHARVSGTGAEAYDVWVFFEQPTARATLVELDGECTCSALEPCEHMVAVACKALLGRQRAPTRKTRKARKTRKTRKTRSALETRTACTTSEAREATPVPTRSPSRDLERWAEALVRASLPTRTEVAQPRSHELVFVVGVMTTQTRADRPAVVLETRSVRIGRGGPTGAHQRYDLDAALARAADQRAAWLRDGDLALWVRLQTLARREPDVRSHGQGRIRVPLHAEGAALFAELLATGRCHLDTADGVTLQPAEAARGRVVWRLDESGCQELRVERVPEAVADGEDEGDDTCYASEPAEEWTVLPLSPLHYVERDTGRCGPIELDVPLAAQPLLAAVPRIEPEDTRALPARTSTALARLGVPPPRKLVVRKPRRVRTKPALRLYALKTTEAAVPAASLGFEYDGHLVDASDPRTRLVLIDGNRLDRIERDLAAEEQFRSHLARHGLVGHPAALTMADLDQWYELSREGVAALAAEGWRVDVDDDFEWNAITVDEWYAHGREDEEDREAWFLELGVVIDGERVNILPAIVAAIRAGTITRERLRLDGRPLVVALPDGRRVELPCARIQTMLDVLVELTDERALSGDALRLVRLDAVRLHALSGFTWDIAPRLRALADRLREGPIETLAPPPGLVAELRDYQLRGLSWLQWLREGELGGILADDMGLGKTLQALAHVLTEKRAGRLDPPRTGAVLVVAPRSVLRNWQREAERFTPELRAAIYHGPDRTGILDGTEAPDLVITTYALMQRDPALVAAKWHLVILDEAQAIKNPVAKVSIAARALQATQRVCMTGTPMENNLGDLWSLMSFVNPGLLGTSRQFAAWYRTPIEREGEMARFDALCARIAPFMLRRTKAQVLAELPPKTEIVLNAELDGPQRDLYESVRLTMEKRVRDELSRRGLAKSRIIVLDALLKLRQVCCDPRLVKLSRARAATRSAKLEVLLELVEGLVGEGRRALVFSQFTTMLAMIERELSARDIGWLSITGKATNRQAIVDRFQAGEAPILLVSLKAGGTGLNLTAADTVIHYDPWWNPAVEAQATDRAHRFGQTQPITVYRLICEGTVEERILALQAKKSALVRGIHDSAERRATSFALAADEIAALLAPIDDGHHAEVARAGRAGRPAGRSRPNLRVVTGSSS